MDRIFDYEDAKRLCVSHKQILDTIRRTLASRSNDEASFKREASEILNSKVIASQILAALQTGNINLQTQPNERALLQAAYKLAEGEKIMEDLQDKEKERQQIVRDINAVNAVSSSLKWFFSGNGAKQAANEGYRRLSEMMTGNYPTAVKELEKKSQELDALPANEAYIAVLGNEHTYAPILAKHVPELVQRENLPPEISQKIINVKDIVGQFQTAQNNQKNREQMIKSAVNQAISPLIMERAMQELRNHDLDVLSQKRSGLRIKALRERGYRNLADIQAASVHQLASIHGISADAAHVIKATCNEVAQEIARTVKLKINSDERTPAATALLKATYRFDRIRKAERSITPDVRKRLEETGKYTSYLSTLNNNLCWEFSNTVQKKRYIQSYQAIESGLSSSEAGVVKQYAYDVLNETPVTDTQVWADFVHRSIDYFNLLEELCPGLFGNDDLLYGLPEELAREIQDQVYFPQGLKVTLRRYQEWGVKYILHQGKVLLGDEMGLGKTVQAIATMVSLRNTGAKKFLVVCPASVLPNWCKEIDKKSEFRSVKIHGYGRQAAFDSWNRIGGVAVTTYETLSTLKIPAGMEYDLLVVDEAHFIKNENAQRSQFVRLYGTYAKRLLYMTGTALENKVDEMLSLIQVLNPRIAAQAQPIAYMSTAPKFRQLIAPVYYRRKREDVLTELPDITSSNEWCDLMSQERDAYRRAVLAKDRSAIRKVSWVTPDLNQSAKARRLKEIVEEATSDNRKVLVFSFYLETIDRVIEVLGRRCTQPINGSVNVNRRQEIIDEFEKMPAGSVLPAQIQAGGTGLNIQAASVVVICEPQLKPSIENQAISRAYRMGQSRKVLVYRLLASDTIDERIDEMLSEKQAIFNAFADISEAASVTQKEEQQIDDKTFGKLIQEEIDRINDQSGNPSPPQSKKYTETVKQQETAQRPVRQTTPVYQGPQKSSDSSMYQTQQKKPYIPPYGNAARKSTTSAYKEQPMVGTKSGFGNPPRSSHSSAYKEQPMVQSPSARRSSSDSQQPVRKGVLIEKNRTNTVPGFASLEDFMKYASESGARVKDNREKGGCVWISSDPRINAIIEKQVFGDRRFKYSAKSKALDGESGWYY